MFNALGQPTRRRIMETLAVRPTGVTGLCDYVGVSQGTMSYHIEILRQAGLVGTSRGGLCVDKGGLCRLMRYIDQTLMS
ncbi:MAG: metalloregulator ArsR/SmtB family transcription factor [Coriobacteriia bacterium]|nr:metalloregulator ArsR/SmtB family transcription factor [Coriobacteriia bacterium]